MKSSLYVRLVAAFIVIVIVSIGGGMIMTDVIYYEKYRNDYRSEAESVGDDIINFYQISDDEQFQAFLKTLSRLHPFHLLIYKGTEQIYKYNDPTNELKEQLLLADGVDHVLNGEAFTCEDCFAVGIPFEKNGQQYALFIEPNMDTATESDDWSFEIIIGLVLLMGSLLMMLVGLTIIRPIRNMTNVTAQLASGNFNVQIPSKRKDELGTLARSFNRMAQQLNQLEMMRQNFVSNVSHEIQSPLTSIRGFSIALRDREFSEEERRKYLSIIIEESERLSRLGENLLRLASLDSEQHPFYPEVYSLDEQIRRVVLSAEPQRKEKQLEIELQLVGEFIQADADQLNQVWNNLLSNSIKFCHAGGRISMTSFSPKPGYIAVKIEDTGVGISDEELPHIFERFYKADLSRDRSSPGNGLGLAIVKKIIDLHHGTIEATSRKGEGTTFCVVLPVSQSPPADPIKKKTVMKRTV